VHSVSTTWECKHLCCVQRLQAAAATARAAGVCRCACST
jgi:hypothetical protein